MVPGPKSHTTLPPAVESEILRTLERAVADMEGPDFVSARSAGLVARAHGQGAKEPSAIPKDAALSLTVAEPVVTSAHEKATVAGYLEGRVIRSGVVLEEGPWRMEASLTRRGRSWRLERLAMATFEVPELEYFTNLPEAYGEEASKKWPLILFLHGAGERGPLEVVRSWTEENTCVPKVANEHPSFPFVVVTPSCPAFMSWERIPHALQHLLDEVSSRYEVDPDRVYLTGLSMGGCGTWSFASFLPDRFAAIAPVCGTAGPARMERLRHLPVWAFHGALDETVPFAGGQAAVEALRRAGGNVKFTVYPDVAHDSWERAYAGSDLYDWFLEHRRR
jgi:predicted esterase